DDTGGGSTPFKYRKVDPTIIKRTDNVQDTSPAIGTDDFKSGLVDYGKKLENAEAKSEAEEEKIKRLAESQQKVLDAEKYSFGWCKALLELEILKSNENKSNSKEVSISFGRVERDPDTQRTLILKYPNRYIPQFMEDLENIPLVLRTAKNAKSPKKVEIEVAGIRHNTLSAKLKDTFKVDDIDLNEVIEARIDVNNPIFLLDELQKEFNALGFAEDYNMRDNLCANIEFVFGPPGTGKTTHLADKIRELMDKPDDKKILVLTPTNKAADVLVNKIISRAENKSYLDWLLRFGTTDDKDVEKSGVFHDKTYNITSKRKNVTVTTIARFPYDFFMPLGKKISLREMKWDYIIIDEASMIMLAQILLPLYKKTPMQFIIAGDPFQIEPVTMIDLWKGENIYTLVGLNDFAKPNTHPHNYTVTKLMKQYRSLPAIGEIFSRFAYGGKLEHARADSKPSPLNINDWLEVQPLNIIKFPVEDYESIYRSRRLGGKSSYQIYSALFTFEFVRALRERIDKKISIGIISPYRAQADLIEKLFAPTKCDIQIGTIHTFQGDECDILIAVFNTPPTISNSPEMFLNRLNIINVAISRARDYLFIVMPDDKTNKIENLQLVKRVESLFANEGYGEFSARDIEESLFGKRN
ncbi:MAG: DNA2/NAM7 family helicase, partial [Selenomonadaceae bacterium]|nr:DNA2/NAM7 family helicase [Selenomonadaceae bacterium]